MMLRSSRLSIAPMNRGVSEGMVERVTSTPSLEIKVDKTMLAAYTAIVELLYSG